MATDAPCDILWPQLPFGHFNCVTNKTTEDPDDLFQIEIQAPGGSPTSASYNFHVGKSGTIVGFRAVWQGSGGTAIDFSLKNNQTATTVTLTAAPVPGTRDLYEYTFSTPLDVTRGDVVTFKVDLSAYSGSGDSVIPEIWGDIISYGGGGGGGNFTGLVANPTQAPAIDFVYEQEEKPIWLGHCMIANWREEFAQASVDAIGNEVSYPFEEVIVQGLYASCSWLDDPTVIKIEDASSNSLLGVCTLEPFKQATTVSPANSYNTGLHQVAFDTGKPITLSKGQVVRVYVEQTGGANVFAARLQGVDLNSHVAIGSGRYAQASIRDAGVWQTIFQERFLMGLWLSQITVED